MDNEGFAAAEKFLNRIDGVSGAGMERHHRSGNIIQLDSHLAHMG